jgi:acetone carboxylase gamma subunit
MESMMKTYLIFNKEYNKGEIIKCECGNDVFEVLEDLKLEINIMKN